MADSSLLLYGGLACFLVLMGSLFFAPLRLAVRLGLRLCLGFAGLMACSLCAAFLGITVGINVLNTAVVAVLGPAGAALLMLLGWSL